ncbi:ATP-binding cassette sub- G member 1 [Blyttiomyces sp. JEL0837]|nr:ATP-binding cassette sub- G member 1 [Blyttiomyces sp. JEL0837]
MPNKLPPREMRNSTNSSHDSLLVSLYSRSKPRLSGGPESYSRSSLRRTGTGRSVGAGSGNGNANVNANVVADTNQEPMARKNSERGSGGVPGIGVGVAEEDVPAEDITRDHEGPGETQKQSHIIEVNDETKHESQASLSKSGNGSIAITAATATIPGLAIGPDDGGLTKNTIKNSWRSVNDGSNSVGNGEPSTGLLGTSNAQLVEGGGSTSNVAGAGGNKSGLHGAITSRVVFLESREMLGSSFQLSHVVPEDEEEEEEDIAPLNKNIAVAIAAASVPSSSVNEQDLEIHDELETDAASELPTLQERMAHSKQDSGATSTQHEPMLMIHYEKDPKEHRISEVMRSQEDIFQMTVGMVDEQDRMEVTFENLTYGVLYNRTLVNPDTGKRYQVKEEKAIIRGISGVFKPGRLTVIMGASGAGKTSLLNIIAGEVKTGNLSGKIAVNSQEIQGEAIKQISGFVFQDDVILPTMTVREAIEMSALLRLPKSMTPEERSKRVDDVIESLNLWKAENTIIGDSQIKGVSGGERKRCAMAMEMLTKPGSGFVHSIIRYKNSPSVSKNR